MAPVIHVHFNSVFEGYIKTIHPDTYKAIMQTVAQVTSEIITHYSIVNRCPQKINDEIRQRVPTENILIYAVLKKYVLTFMDHRDF